MERTICIYHANCCDGMGAAWVVHRALNENRDVEFIAATYHEEPPEVQGAHVIIVDFSYKQPQMIELAKQAASILVIDHHKTAEAELAPLLEAGVIEGIFDMNKSGAILTWEWFYQDQSPPKLLEHIQDRDLWRFELTGTREIQAALYSYPMTLDTWDALLESDYIIDRLYDEGTAIDRAHKKNVSGLVEFCAHRITIAGHNVPALNCNYMFASDAGHELSTNEPFSVTYYDTQEHRKFSLRSSRDGGVDVSEIAKRFGGGGHKNAAGFKVIKDEINEHISM